MTATAARPQLSTDPRVAGLAELVSSGPSSSPDPVTTCRTPGGRPASWISCMAISALKGVCESVFMTTALPAASAGNVSLIDNVSG